MDSERNEIWIEAYRYFYLAYYNELLASALGRRWDRWGSAINFVIALTASGSAVSVWALKTDWGVIVWSVLAGSASILSIAQSSLHVSSRVRKQTAVRRKFARIRSRLQETLEDIIRGEEPVRIRKDIRAQRTRYFALTESADPDLFQTNGLKARVKTELENVVRELGLYGQGIMAVEKAIEEINDVGSASAPE